MGDTVDIVTNQTPFYGESGGQVGAAGIFSNDDGLRAIVADTKKHLGRVWAQRATIEKGAVPVGDPIRMEVYPFRRAAIRANLSSTHLLHADLPAQFVRYVAPQASLSAPASPEGHLS